MLKYHETAIHSINLILLCYLQYHSEVRKLLYFLTVNALFPSTFNQLAFYKAKGYIFILPNFVCSFFSPQKAVYTMPENMVIKSKWVFTISIHKHTHTKSGIKLRQTKYIYLLSSCFLLHHHRTLICYHHVLKTKTNSVLNFRNNIETWKEKKKKKKQILKI